MNRFFLALIASLSFFTLSACGGGKPADPLAQNCGVERTMLENFSLCLPTGWSVQTQAFGDEGNIVAMISDEEHREHLMQIHVKKDPLQAPVQSSMVFAQQAADIARDTAPNYSAVRTENITVDAKETLLHVFDASPSPESGTIRYYQFVTTHANTAYGFTAVIAPGVNEEVEAALLDMLMNVKFT